MSHHSHPEHDTPNSMPFEAKLTHLVEHWIRHNREHIRNYREWAGRARERHLDETADQIEAAAAVSDQLEEMFQKALSALEHSGKIL